MIKKTVLKNNVTLISQFIENAKTVAIGFYFSVGSRYEKKGERGISHFCEHLLFKGTENFSRREIACTFDRIGGSVNAFTERDDVCVYAVVPSSKENFCDSMKILCDMSSSCVFPEEEIEKERSVVENEIISVEDDPEESALDVMASLIWKGSGLGQTITGTVSDVENLDRNKILDWYKKFFVHGELNVFVCGNFSESDAEFYLEKLPEHKRKMECVDPKPVWNVGNYFVKSGFGQQQIYVSYPMLEKIDEKKYWTMTVFNALFGDSMGSRLFETLREKNGLCYSVYSFFSTYADNGIWSCYASCEKKYLEKTFRLMQQELKNLFANEISDSEVEAAKGHLCGEELMGDCDMEFVMRRNQKNYFMGLKLFETEEILSSIRNVTKNDIIELIQSVIKNDKRTVFVYGKKLSKIKQKEILL